MTEEPKLELARQAFIHARESYARLGALDLRVGDVIEADDVELYEWHLAEAEGAWKALSEIVGDQEYSRWRAVVDSQKARQADVR